MNMKYRFHIMAMPLGLSRKADGSSCEFPKSDPEERPLYECRSGILSCLGLLTPLNAGTWVFRILNIYVRALPCCV